MGDNGLKSISKYYICWAKPWIYNYGFGYKFYKDSLTAKAPMWCKCLNLYFVRIWWHLNHD